MIGIYSIGHLIKRVIFWPFCRIDFLIYAKHQLHRPTKKDFFQNALEVYTYSGAEWCSKHDVAFRFSLNYTVFPWLYVETSKIADFRGNTFFFDWPKKILLIKKISTILHIPEWNCVLDTMLSSAFSKTKQFSRNFMLKLRKEQIFDIYI